MCMKGEGLVVEGMMKEGVLERESDDEKDGRHLEREMENREK